MGEPLACIVGPTAVGKTQVAIEVAKHVKAEIISGDSMQVYRYMDIGTAKPAPEERRDIPHHMIDVLDPDERFSVADYQRMVRGIISEIRGRGRLPLLVGGTGLYIRAITDSYYFPQLESDQGLRERLRQQAELHGTAQLHSQLAEVDPEAASRIHPNDLRRIIRALEVYYRTGFTMTHFMKQKSGQPEYDTLLIGLNMPREELYRRIDRRVDQMMQRGLVQEVKALLDKGYHEALPSMKALGYKEIVDYLKGRCTLDEAVRLFKRNTRRFAKRQLTWFRKDPRIRWLEVGENIHEIVEKIVTLIAQKWDIW